MRPVTEWDESDLIALIRDEVQESLSLDYKQSGALTKGNIERNNLSKDVSAFANSEGGIIIYGLIENGHVPIGIDAGSDRTLITKEWLESVIKSTIHPIVDGVSIKQISLSGKGQNAVAYAVEIPPATSRAPHQAFDHRYYKRFNFESTPMEDYEIRDLMRRGIEYGKRYSTAWNLNVELQRLLPMIHERGQFQNGQYVPRDTLMIAISPSLRSAGDAVVALDKPTRELLARFIGKVDDFNAEIETADPGQGIRARLNDRLRGWLAEAFTMLVDISNALKAILEREP